MSAEGAHLEYLIITKKTINFVEIHSRTIHAMFALNWLTGARAENFHTFFLIASNDKTMSADGGHLNFPIGTKNITFVEVHPMTIHDNVCFELVYLFQRRCF